MINCINDHSIFSQVRDSIDLITNNKLLMTSGFDDQLIIQTHCCRTHMHGLWCRTDSSFVTLWLDRYRPIGARARGRALQMKVVARSRYPDAEQNVDICERRCGRSSTSRRANAGTRSEPRSEQSRMLLLFSVDNNTNKASSTQLTINTFYLSTHLHLPFDLSARFMEVVSDEIVSIYPSSGSSGFPSSVWCLYVLPHTQTQMLHLCWSLFFSVWVNKVFFKTCAKRPHAVDLLDVCVLSSNRFPAGRASSVGAVQVISVFFCFGSVLGSDQWWAQHRPCWDVCGRLITAAG